MDQTCDGIFTMLACELENQLNMRVEFQRQEQILLAQRYLGRRMLDAPANTDYSPVVDPEDLQPLQPMSLEDGQEEPLRQGEPQGQEKPQDQEEKIE